MPRDKLRSTRTSVEEISSPAPSTAPQSVPVITSMLRRDRPEVISGLPWDVRAAKDYDRDKASFVGVCEISNVALRRLDYALRLTLLVVLPLTIICYNGATAHVFVSPSITIICAIVVPQPRVGRAVFTAQAVLAAIVIQQALTYAIFAIQPSRHWAFWYAVYVLVSLFVAFTTEGTVTKLSLYFLNIMMVNEYYNTFPNNDKYMFAFKFAYGALIGVAFGIFAPFFPYPRTNRDDAQRALEALFHNYAVCFAGCCQCFYVPGPNPSVQRRINLNRVLACRATASRYYSELDSAVDNMMFELHRQKLHDRMRARLAVAADFATSLDGLINVLRAVAREPAEMDDLPLSRRWGERLAVPMNMSCDFVEEICIKAGDINWHITEADLQRIERVRHWMRIAYSEARTDMIEQYHLIDSSASPQLSGVPLHSSAYGSENTTPRPPGSHTSGPPLRFPFLTVGYFTYNFGRALRAFTSMPLENPRATDNKPDLPEATESREPMDEFPQHSVEVPIDPVPVDAFAKHPTPASDPSNRLTPLPVDPVEHTAWRALLYWPRCCRDSLLLFRRLAEGDKPTLLKLRESFKLVFCMATALAIILTFEERFPASGSSTIAFVKDANAATTMLATMDYIAVSILGSIYGFLGVALVDKQWQLVLAICIICLVLSYVRAHPRYAYPAYLVTFFVVSTMAPGVTNEKRMFATIKVNVASITWLAITHAFLWPQWPSVLVQSDLRSATDQVRDMVMDLFTAIESEKKGEGAPIALSVLKRRRTVRKTLHALRDRVAVATAEPSFRSVPFPDREYRRVLDALEAVAMLIFPVASAVIFLDDLPVPTQPRESRYVPAEVFAILQVESRVAATQVDQLLRCIASIETITADVTHTLLQQHAEVMKALHRNIHAGMATYTALLHDSLDARPYEMPAINTVMYFYHQLGNHLDALLQATLEAHHGLSTHNNS
jgi:uncharacterized membrane protein YgaE (UPF0421/DUF939 family)